jgi:tetratricopeptide (TPR) repeat protein
MDDAIKLLDSIQKSDPSFMAPQILMLLGDRLYSNVNRDYEGALDYYKKACALLPSDPICHTKLGQVYEKIREFDLATESYRKALKRDPKAFTPLMRLGLVLIRNNQKDKGLKFLH